MKQPQGGKPAYIGGRVPEALRLRLLDASTLYGVPYIELLERSVKHYLDALDYAAHRVLTREVRG